MYLGFSLEARYKDHSIWKVDTNKCEKKTLYLEKIVSITRWLNDFDIPIYLMSLVAIPGRMEAQQDKLRSFYRKGIKMSRKYIGSAGRKYYYARKTEEWVLEI